MVIDYKNKNFALENGIRIMKSEHTESFYFCKNSKKENESFAERHDAIYGSGNYSGFVFKNFPNLYLNNSTFENCIFEGCGSVEPNNCTMKNCTFSFIENSVGGSETEFYNCCFKDSNPTEAILYIENDCKVDGCTFENIHATSDDGQICRMVSDKEKNISYLTNCKFINCTMENKYNCISSCSYKRLGRSYEMDNLDESCEICEPLPDQKTKEN